MKNDINIIKLKHLPHIVSDKPDFKYLIEDIYGFRNIKLLKTWRFKWRIKKLIPIFLLFKTLDPKSVVYNDTSSIRIPNNIDSISFQAMMEAQALSNNERELSELIRDLICTTCFTENCDVEKYDSQSDEFKAFKEKVYNTPLVEAFAIYNELDKKLNESKELWTREFFRVEVIDRDFQQAGGDIMSRYNIVNTIKAICSDFNITYGEAWQMSYSLTQTNSLAKATQAFIQDRMRVLKENRMRAEKRRNK